ncbi:MAG: metal ABC transporter permease [Planctomycetota bacterium]
MTPITNTLALIEFSPGPDLFPLVAALLATATCGLLGNFLVLRKQALMGDAISHAVLPGLVIAFILTSSRSPLLMFGGAAVAGLVTVVLIEAVKKLGRVEPGAAMGVVFSVMFALGVLLIEQAAARSVELHADCVLYGQLETLAWFTAPPTLVGVFQLTPAEFFAAVPRQVWTLAVMAVFALGFVLAFFKELRIAAFDPGLATAQGISANLMHYLLMAFVAAATVAAFEAVGSILVIAMLIAPAATARLLTDRLAPQITVSLAAAAVAATLGYLAATTVPLQLHALGVLPSIINGNSVNAAGSITVVAGLLVIAAALFSPSHGLIARSLRRKRLGQTAAVDDLLTTLYRFHELKQPHPDPSALPAQAIKTAAHQRWVETTPDTITLTDAGLSRAAALLRKHRLWEDYLVTDAGLLPDHVHDAAEQFEHLTLTPTGNPTTDPHGKPIPPMSD